MLPASPLVVTQHVEVWGVIRHQLAQAAGQLQIIREIRRLRADQKERVDGQGAFRIRLDEFPQPLLRERLVRCRLSRVIVSGSTEQGRENLRLYLSGEFVRHLPERLSRSLGPPSMYFTMP